ncbi:transmembrane protein, putative [Babesia ovis]|uniref:Transmembrane protein, putative n=1 Tax=Babesia ovis TaxID=5869 RepID=A0A9W5TAB4_BABOV|nr:transmembrane protein, putative [Babesia ovis]
MENLMKFLFVWVLAILVCPAIAVGTKGRFHASKSTHMHQEHMDAFDEDFSTNGFMANYDGDVALLLDDMVKQDNINALLDSPLKFFYSRKSGATEGTAGDKDELQRTVAECTLTQEEGSGSKSKTIYLSLKDAEDYGRRIEDAKRRINSANVEDIPVKHNIDLTCKSVVIDDETKRCHVCLYAEVLIPNKHIRYGHLGHTSVLECLNGYDNDLNKNTASRSYFINSAVNYHPVCIAA